MTLPLTDDAQVRAMVALLEAQAAQIVSLRRAVETMEGRLSLRNAMDAVVSDEVQQSLADLRMALQALRRLPSGDRHSQWLADEASRRVELLATRIGELLAPAPLSPVVMERESVKEVAIADVLDRALDGVPGVDRSAVRRKMSPDLVVSTAPARLAAILAALIDNGTRHGGGSVECDAHVLFGDLVVRVVDEGPGFGGTDPESLFPTPGAALGESNDEGTVGVGLYVARMLARSLGGDVTLAERPEGGVVATVTVPQRRDGDAAPRTMRDISAGW